MSSISYHTSEDSISEDKMQYTVTHHYPQYSEDDAKAVRAEIAEQLFAVFSGVETGRGLEEYRQTGRGHGNG